MNPRSKRRLARTHSIVDVASICHKLITCILMQYFLSRNMKSSYALYVVCSFVSMGVLWIVRCPYYRTSVTGLRVAGLWIGAWFAALTGIVEAEAAYGFADGHADSIVAALGLLTTSLLCWRFYEYRVSRRFKEGLHNLRYHFTPVDPDATLPAGLSNGGSLGYTWSKSLQLDESEMDDAHTERSINFAPSYVDTAVFDTDCELATRFLHAYIKNTSIPPNSTMLNYVTGTYVKGLLTFKDSGHVLLSFAAFLIYFKKEFIDAKEILSRLAVTDSSLALRYQAFKLLQMLKVDSTQMERYSKAKSYHRESLQKMIDFWKVLLAEEVDRHQLDLCARHICSESDFAVHEYLHALRLEDTDKQIHRSDIRMITHYGLFFEQILRNQDLANRCFNVAAELIKVREQRAVSGAKKAAIVSETGLGQLPQKNEAKTAENSRGATKVSGRDAILQAGRMLNFVFSILAILLSGFLILSIIWAREKSRVLDAIGALGRAHSNALHAVVHVEAAKNPPADFSEEDVQENLVKLADVAESFHTNVNSFLSYSSYQSLDQLFKQPYFLVTTNTIQSPTFLSLWSMCYTSLQSLHSISYTAGTEISDSDYKMITTMVPYTLSDALKQSLDVYHDWNDSNASFSQIVLFCIYLSSVFLIAIVFVMLVIKFNAVETTKNSIRNVVTVIPKDMVAALVEQATEALNRFDTHANRPEVIVTRDLDAVSSAHRSERFKGHTGFTASDTDNTDRETDLDGQPQRVDKEIVLNIRDDLADRGPPVKVSCLVQVLFVLVVILPFTWLGTLTLNASVAGTENTVHIAIDSLSGIAETTEMFRVVNEGTALFVLDPSIEAYDMYWKAVHTMTRRSLRNRVAGHALSVGLERTQVIGTCYDNTEKVHSMYKSAMTLVATGSGQDLSAYPQLVVHEWTAMPYFTQLPKRQFLPGKTRPLSASAFDLTDNSTVDPEELGRDNYFSHAFVTTTLDIVREWVAVERLIIHDAVSDVDAVVDMEQKLHLLEIVLCCAFIVTVMTLMAGSATQPFLRSPVRLFCLVALLFLSTAFLIVSVAASQLDIPSRVHKVESCSELKQVNGLFQMEKQISAFAASGDLVFWEGYESERTELLAAEALYYDHISRVSGRQKFEQSWASIQDLVFLWDIAGSIAAHAHELPSEVFDRKPWTEVDYAHVHVSLKSEFMASNVRFTNTAADVERGNLTQLALFLTCSPFSIASTRDAHDSVLHAVEEACDAVEGSFYGAIHEYEQERVVRLGLCAATVLTAVFWCILVVKKLVTGGKPLEKKERGDEMKAKNAVKVIDLHIKQMVYALALVMVLVTAIFTFSFVTQTASDDTVSRLGSASGRQWLTARSMYLAERIRTDRQQYEALLPELEQTIVDLSNEHRTLYFGEDRNRYSGVARHGQQDSLLFAPDTSIPVAYAATCPAEYSSAVQDELAYGLHSAMERWMALHRELTAVSFTEQRRMNALIAEMRSSFSPLMDSLHYSTLLYQNDADTKLSTSVVYTAIAVGTAILLMLLDFVAVFLPIMRELRSDEKTTQLILRLLPTAVTELPQVMAMLEEGSATAAEKDVQVSDAVVQMSPYPLISIDNKGVILKFSSAAVKAYFGYTTVELTGANVRFLMPEEYSKNHDQYLANYRRTGIQHVINTTRAVRGKKKSGEEFPCEIIVRQFKCAGEDMFIGSIRSLLQDNYLKAVTARNNVIQKMNLDAVLTMDAWGTVLSCNMAAVRVFEYGEEEVVGSNVKMLMSPEIAQVHDSILATYRATGVKSVVGSRRKTTGQRKSGEAFAIEIKVDEVRCNPKVFVGFVKDISEDEQLEQEHEMNDAISNQSITAIITIDQKGIVLTFSYAAERMFICAESAIQGKNINTLMPLSVGAQHDEYLAIYARNKVRRVLGSTFDSQAKRTDGTLFDVKIGVEEVTYLGRTTYVGFLIDLSDQRRIEAENEMTAKVNLASPNGIIVATEYGIILSVNAKVLSMFGMDEHELIGENLKIMMPPKLASIHDQILKTYRATKVKHVIDSTREAYAMRKNGEEFPVSLRVCEVINRGQVQYVGFLVSREDTRDLELGCGVNNAVLAVSSEAVVLINQFGIVVQFSPAATRTWGYQETEIVGQNVKILTPPSIASHHDEYLRNYLKTGVKTIVDSERDVISVGKDGMEIQVRIRVAEVMVNGDRVYVGFVRNNADEMKVSRKKLYVTELNRIIPVPIVTINLAGTVVEFTAASSRIFGYERHEVVGKNVSMLMDTVFAENHDSHMTAYRRTRTKHIVDTKRRVPGRTKRGETVHLELFLTELNLFGLKATKETCLLGMCYDITEQVAYEELTRNVDTLTNLSATAVIVINHMGTIMKFSRAAETLFGWKNKEALGSNVSKLMPEPHKSKHNQYLTQYRKTGIKHVIDTSFLVTGVNANGSEIHMELKVVEKVFGAMQSFIGYAVDYSTEHQMEKAVKLNEAIEQLSDFPLIFIDSVGTVLRANKAVTTMFDYDPADLVGNNLTMMMPPEIAAEHDHYLKKYRETGVKHIIGSSRFVNVKRLDGQMIPVELYVAENKSDKETCFVGCMRDRRQDIENEKVLQVNEAMIDFSYDALVMISDHGFIRLFSQSACRLFGYTKEEVMGQNLKMLMPDEIAEHHDEYLRRYRETGVKKILNTQLHLRAKHKGGYTFPVKSMVKEIKTESNVFFFGYLIDVTLETQQQSEKLLGDSIFQWSTIPMLSIDHMGTVLLFNDAAEQEFGYDKSAAIGKNVKFLMTPDVANNHDGYLARYYTTREKHVVDMTTEQIAVSSSGTKIPIELSVKQLSAENEDGSLNFIAYARNITEATTLRYTSNVIETMTHLSPVTIILINQKGRILTFSKAGEAEFGYEMAEIIGKKVNLLMPDDIAKKHDGYIKKFIVSQVKKVVGKTTLGFHAKRKSGELFPCELTVQDIQKEGLETLFVGCVRDYTEDLKIQDTIVTGQSILDASVYPLIVISEKGIVKNFSEAATSIFGWPAEEIVGNNIKMLMPEDIAIQHDGLLARYLDDHIKRVIDTKRVVEGKSKTGLIFEVQLMVKEIYLNGVYTFVSYVKDLTTQKNLEWESKLSAVINYEFEDPLVTIDSKSVITKFNKAAENAFGFPEGQVIGRNVRVLMPEEMSGSHESYVRGWLRKNSVTPLSVRRTVSAETKDGAKFTCPITIMELRLPDEDPSFTARFHIKR
ncbi:Sensor protein FixL [Diplonema papillatum]|nr:Sensor protein FixL [Diplonema papillatum]